MVGVCVKMLAMPIITINELMGPHAERTVAAFNVITIEHAEGIVAGPFGAGDNAFGVLDRDNVEGGDGSFGMRAHEFVDRDDWHGQHLDADPNHTQGFPINASGIPTERMVVLPMVHRKGHDSPRS